MYTIQDEDDFFSSSEKIWRNLAFTPLDPLQWMGAVRIRVVRMNKSIIEAFTFDPIAPGQNMNP